MEAPIKKRTGKGTINAIRKIWVDATSTKFALVIPDNGCSRLAIRIGLNLTAEGDDYFLVGDKVRYTVLTGPGVEFPRAQDLVKFGVAGLSDK
ncbi:hypothetical protein [Pseudomonas sp. PGPR40]|uniref:hypothetical protein n=1 Tax=Pseudomonas sp. PGPR40 TaxID=2913476 RepID=UPI001ED9CF2E|nr:hypothetical protein [Pseudomonas sp. PGPR40]